jgi:hypothetical protein
MKPPLTYASLLEVVSVNRSTTVQEGHKCRSEMRYDEYD